jgi:hypothetical protein
MMEWGTCRLFKPHVCGGVVKEVRDACGPSRKAFNVVKKDDIPPWNVNMINMAEIVVFLRKPL